MVTFDGNKHYFHVMFQVNQFLRKKIILKLIFSLTVEDSDRMNYYVYKS